MPQRTWHDDEEDWSETGGDYDSDDHDSNGYDSDADNLDDADPDEDSIPCPECGIDVYADLDHCPRCGHWLTDSESESRETGLFATRRVRLIAAALLAIFLFSLLAELFLLN